MLLRKTNSERKEGACVSQKDEEHEQFWQLETSRIKADLDLRSSYVLGASFPLHAANPSFKFYEYIGNFRSSYCTRIL